ncbi:MAG: histidine--tRNA ligase [Armatimonadota bacterium]|nr:histidine--tRNA ligase [Armatimonadota bacterium]
MAKYAAPRGTNDILPSESPKWQFVESKFREICSTYGYREIRTPVFEDTNLFTRSIGEATDIVSKEMYTFTDRGGRSITLRAEGTAPVVRAYVEHNLSAELPLNKLYYITSVFRYERPQAGRYRQHHQLGVEAIGSADPSLDAEVIGLGMSFLRSLGVESLELKLNSVGCANCRPAYREALRRYVEPFVSELCPSCQIRYEANPLRMLDCKEEKCRELLANAPSILDILDDDCRSHFEDVKRYLGVIGVPFTADSRLVRGFDYYTKTVFEIVSEQLGAQNSVLGGGRYDNLVEELGGQPTPSAGFGMGEERLLMTLERLGVELPVDSNITAFVATLGDAARETGFHLLSELRGRGIASEMDFGGRSLKAQMRLAGKLSAKYVILLGEDEIARGIAMLKNMETGEQAEVDLSEVASRLLE